MIIEAKVREYLNSAMYDVPVTVGIPNEIEKDMVCVRKIDSSKVDQINMATIEILSYASTRLGAAECDEEIQGMMEGFDADPEVLACKYGGGNDYTDTSLKHFRYRSYFNIYY